MNILPIHAEILEYLEKHSLERKFKKQCYLFEINPFHPSLRAELLEPKEMKIYATEHELNEAARQDRLAWLRVQLGLAAP